MSASSHNFPAFSSANRWASLILFLCVLVVVYFFFADWQTRTIYGDDLYVFKTHSEATDLSTKWNFTSFVS
ncbi:MAG: hypothetical protein EOO01_23670 [Chitinophagaceae bacterium]|nr:MAG: hypothetical protein EOO01_23670 [Chitinophagaceae bacterium]